MERSGLRETVVSLSGPVNLKATLECGQAFRWRRASFPGRPGLVYSYRGVIGPLAVVVGQTDRMTHEVYVAWEEPEGAGSCSSSSSPSSSSSCPCCAGVGRVDSGLADGGQGTRYSPVYVEEAVKRYFSDGDDIASIEERLARSGDVMAAAVQYSRGLRILTQDPWECLGSFVLSLNKNIPAISQSIEYLATCYGESAGMGAFAFPTPQAIACQEVASLRRSRCGYRDKYLHDAACKVTSGQVDLVAVGSMPTDEARKELMRISGVGPKVADCVLLFGYHRLEVFPVDVWIARAVSWYFMGGRDLSPREAREYGERRFGDLAGYAQEYLFYWIRNTAKS